MKTWIGIDNGISGTIGIIKENGETFFFKTPIKSEQNYTIKKGNISRIEKKELSLLLSSNIDDLSRCHVILERPLVNPTRFQASISAMRALEATLIVLEELNIPYEYTDSKKWQGLLLPKGLKGSELLKKASMDIGCRLFPQHSELIKKQKDADGILIAEYCKRNRL